MLEDGNRNIKNVFGKGRVIIMDLSVKKYKIRRAQRLSERGYRADEDDDGQWVTTDSGKKIHLNEEGAVDKGSPFTLAVMGKPKDATMPKKSVVLKDGEPFKITAENRADLGEALASRKEKDVVFGGYYKVAESGRTLTSATFFNPYTGEHFSHIVRDSDDDRVTDDLFNSELADVKINKEAQWVWNRSNGIVQEGDTIRVTKGRTLEHGMEAKVKSVRPFYDKYGRKLADYAYLDNGEKINVSNVGIVEDGKLVGEKGESKTERKPVEKKSPVLSSDGVTKAVGKANTRKAIGDALKKAGFKFKDNSGDSGYPNFRIEKDDGGYIRVYTRGSGRSAEAVVQEWNPTPKQKMRSVKEIDSAKKTVDRLKRDLEKNPDIKFKDMDIGQKYAYVVADNVGHFTKSGFSSTEAWSRAIDNAEAWSKKGFDGYGEDIDKETEKAVLGGILKDLRR